MRELNIEEVVKVSGGGSLIDLLLPGTTVRGGDSGGGVPCSEWEIDELFPFLERLIWP